MINKNQPAAPCLGYSGLKKREVLAMAAMQGLLTSDSVEAYDNAGEWKKDIVESSVEFADALLAELERTGDDKKE